MKAMILAAGRGLRLRPYTDTVPKALIEIRGKPLITHHIEQLAKSGIKDIVINLAHLGGQIKQALGDGSNYGVRISYLDEPVGGYETGGGIVNALSLLGDEPFITVNADIFCPFDYSLLPEFSFQLAHLVLIDNPCHNPKGDFSLDKNMISSQDVNNGFTFAGIALYHPQFFKGCEVSRYPVSPMLKTKCNEGLVTGQHYQGIWHDIGTPERLRVASTQLDLQND